MIENSIFAALKITSMNAIQKVEAAFINLETPAFGPGDTVTVHYKIKEGAKERIQLFQGVVLQKRNTNLDETFTVRKISSGIGVERIFPLHSPNIEKIEVNRRGKVRRARIFYLRSKTGKKGRVKEKRG